MKPSAIGRLLEEISWEGNARKYRDGGIGRENVLTTEVFSALEFLPRHAFLGSVLRAAHGAGELRATLAREIENADMEVLPGDVFPSLSSQKRVNWKIQPDVTIETNSITCLVEAKRIKPAAFQKHQVTRTLITALNPPRGNDGFVLLVLGCPPPISVAGSGKLSIKDAVRKGMDASNQHLISEKLSELVKNRVAWITWDEIADSMRTAAAKFDSCDDSANSAIRRLALSAIESVDRHS